MSLIRIDKYLSVACGISRTDAKQLLKTGAITADGIKITKADTKVEESACVKNGDSLLVYKRYIYIAMNKPSGVLSACNDKRVKTVIDLLPEELKREGLFPVGRLDKDTTGLLIITDDGDFGHRIISPKSGIEKCYLAGLDGDITDEDVAAFGKGIILADGEECKPALLERVGEGKARVTISEGKYHQIKRMFGTRGLGVVSLHRLSIGGLFLPEDIPAGGARELKNEELGAI